MLLQLFFIALIVFCSGDSYAHPGLKRPTAAVTYTLSGGRLGDNLLAYLHAKWISYRYGIPVLYKPFPYSDQIAFHDSEQLYTADLARQYRNVAELRNNNFLEINQKSNSLYVIPYFPESLEEHRVQEVGINTSNTMAKTDFPYIAVHWDDKDFLEQIRRVMRPRVSLNLITPPKDCISVAVHVRKNSGGFDRPLLQETADADYNPNLVYVDVYFPLKHTPDSYYIEQIQRIAEMFKDQKLYVFIFTDDPNPPRIVNKYAQEINNDRITFDYRGGDNNHYSNVLEDMFSMMNFDCLIRADSNLSIVASKLGDYKVLITPLHHYWEGRKLIIDKVNVAVKK